MNVDLANAEVALKARQVMRIADGQDARIRCDGGLVWITQDGDPRDVVLGPGQHFTVDRPGSVVLFSMDGATIQLRSCAKTVRSESRGVFARFAAPILRALATLRALHLAAENSMAKG